MTKKLYLETVGCQMNVLDSELVVGSLRRQGYELTHDATDADVILFNTCSVRQHAEDKIYSRTGPAARSQETSSRQNRRRPGLHGTKGPGADPQTRPARGHHLRHRPARSIAGADRRGPENRQAATGAQSRPQRNAAHEVERSFESYDPMRDPSMRPNRFQAYVRIMIGCDKFCTYCIVPSVRGPEQSRRPEHIAAEVRQLAAEGCKEITLLGQTVNSYKCDHGDGRHFRLADLLALIHDTPGLERIKFVTNFPRDMSDGLLDAVRDLPKVCPYLHVPVQSGCNEVLKRMKRLYTVEHYRDMLARCRERVPGVAVSSDFIVGFCGETEQSFEKTCELVREAGFKNSFIFKYSPRPGTKGHELYADDVPEEVKKRRNNDLLAIQNAVSLADHCGQVGKTVEVLVEGPSKNAFKEESKGGPVQLTGRAPTDHIVVFDGNERLAGQIVKVLVEEATSFTLFGTVVTGEIGSMDLTMTDSIAGRVETPNAGRLTLPLV